jgi:hypothetical protein
MCIECASTAFLTADGICKRELYCGKSNVLEENGEKCNCNSLTPTGSIAKVCALCDVRKEPHTEGAWAPTPKGMFRQCTKCKAKTLLYNGECIIKEDCPFENAQYLIKTYGGTCEAPFSCTDNRKYGGDNPGQSCKCNDPRNCQDCSYGRGGAHSCVSCKANTYLLNGVCITGAECTQDAGRTPIEGENGVGGVCV